LPSWDLTRVSQFETDNIGLVTGFKTLAAFEDDRVGGVLGVGRAVDHLIPMGDAFNPRRADPFDRDNANGIPVSPAIVKADEFSGTEDLGPITGNIFGNDIIPNGTHGLTIVPPPIGTLVVQPNGAFTYTCKPACNFDPCSGVIGVQI